MNKGNGLSINDKVSRLKEVKENLETEDYTSISKAAKCLKDATSVTCLGENGMNLVENIDGIYHWIGGVVTKKMAEDLYIMINEKRSEVRDRIKTKTKSKKTNIEERPYNNEDVANMIEEFAKQIYSDRAEILSAISENNKLTNSIKVELFDLNQTMKSLLNKDSMTDEVNLKLASTVKNIETKVKKLVD